MGFLNRLFGRLRSVRPLSDGKGELDRAAVERIVQGYARFHEINSPAPGCVSDASRLPYPKVIIKAALVVALRIERDDGLRSHLRSVYLDLAQWQDGVGPADQGLEISKLNLNDDPRKLAEAVTSTGSGHDRWAPVVLAETDALAGELRTLGLWA